MKAADKQALINKVKGLDGLTNDEKAQLISFIKTKTYGLVWENSTEKAWEQLKEYIPVLVEDKGKAIVQEGNNPNHILIDGDNLLALTNLLYTHEGKVDVIYIDPPYNTGNKDFVYNDSFVDSEDAYRHSKWLSFMEKRLRIAKRLLSDKGVIFISIDDNEQANLKLLCDEVFGYVNFVATLIWKSKSGGANDASHFGVDHEYILCYAFSSDKLKIKNDTEAIVTTSYNKIDSDGRRYALDRLDKQSLGYQKTLDFPITGPDGRVYTVEHKDPNNKKARWRWGKDTVSKRYDELVFIYPYVYTKNYEKNDGQKPRSILFDERFGRTRTGSTDLNKILGNQKIFNYPKPIALLKFLQQVSTDKNSIILDFFAGSGTTLHATMQLNAEDGGHRQCILVTNNENNICEEVTYERNKRVINGYTKQNGEYVEGLHDNNLRYYKVGFVPRDRDLDNVKRFAYNSVSSLCIKENVYKEQKTLGTLATMDPAGLPTRGFRYFKDASKQFLVILNPDVIDDVVKELRKMDVETPIPTYVFTTGSYPYTDDFVDVADKVNLYPYPSCIYGACEKVMPKAEDKTLDMEGEIVISDEEREITVEDLNKE